MQKKTRKNRLAIYVFLGFMSLLLSVGISNSALADVSIVGSWELTEETTGAIYLLSVNKGSTYTVAQPYNNMSIGTGAWLISASDVYNMTDIAFIYDDDGNIVNKQKVRAETVVSADRQSFTATLLVEIIALNGEIINTLNTTATATRINVEPF
jgi:hypothetical protein